MVPTSDGAESYMIVPPGLIFQKDTYVPLDAVTKRAGTDVFINVPKLVVGEMPWDSPPDRAQQRAKYGPPAQEVAKLYRSRSLSGHEQ